MLGFSFLTISAVNTGKVSPNSSSTVKYHNPSPNAGR